DNYNPIQDNGYSETLSKSNSNTNSKSGYLFERRGGRVLQSWNRKYYAIDGEDLICTTRGPKSSREEDQPQTYNLRVCSVKTSDNYDRRFCFELISPMRVIVLQAENERDMQEWVDSIRTANQLALNSDKAPTRSLRTLPTQKGSRPSSTKSKDSDDNRELLQKLRQTPGNEVCADCGAKEPEWASTNLGIIVMLRIGNNTANKIYQEYIPPDMETFRITPSSSRNERDLWITEKYVKRSFVKKQNGLDQQNINQEFWNSIAQSDLPNALWALAKGADVDYRNSDDKDQTALHKAVQKGDEILVDFLLQWSSNVNQQDEDGNTSLHHAAISSNVRLVLCLLKRHAKADMKNIDGKVKKKKKKKKKKRKLLMLMISPFSPFFFWLT
ncbi:uncharacterized protein BX664DRAFT_254931, partial [Halteromyces radiatus]|uniref:uncharacterized protein n=1 Tax=Halteromyces radiatus TaxID=101107 RepID=UPI00221F544D